MKKTLAQLIYDKTKWRVSAYCEVRGIKDAASIGNGYVSKANAKILESDGINWEKASNAKVAGGKNGVKKLLKEDKTKAAS